MEELFHVLLSLFLVFFILDKFGIYTKWKKEQSISNEIIKREKRNIELINAELERRKNLKHKHDQTTNNKRT